MADPAGAERWLKLLLRAGGVLMLLATPAVFMPMSWMAACHRWLGLGAFPDQPIAEYLARSTSALYAMLGALLVLAARDVRRYGPLITLSAVLMLAMSLGILGCMLPRGGRLGVYLVGDAASGTAFAVAVLLLQRRCRRADAGR